MTEARTRTDGVAPHRLSSRRETERLAGQPPKAVFVSWQPHNTRSETLARCFGAKPLHMHVLDFKRPAIAPLKYLILAAKTLGVLYREAPDVIFVLNPPYFSGLTVWLYCRMRGGRYILDSHTGAFIERKWTWLAFLHRWIARRAAVCIVTNEHLGAQVRAWGGRYFIIADVPTRFDPKPIDGLSRPHVTVVNSFSFDEPLKEILSAAGAMPDVNFSITGNLRSCPSWALRQAPGNVRFTGFLPDADYVDLLYSSDAALVLTLQDHTMQRGAYEALSLGVPVVTSGWPLLQRTFGNCAAYCDNSTADIVEKMRDVLGNRARYTRAIAADRGARESRWRQLEREFCARYLRPAAESNR